MKHQINISLILLGVVLTLQFQSCKSQNRQVNQIKVNLDSLYNRAITVAFNGKCFYSPPSPENFGRKQAIDQIFNESYFYFDKKFEDLLVDSTLHFDYKELNELALKPKYFLEVDSVTLVNFNKTSFRKVSDSYKDINFNILSSFSYNIVQENPSFTGFIIFSKPLFRKSSDQTAEIFIRVTRMFDSPRNCFIRLFLKDNKIIDAQELMYTEKLIFR